MCGVYFVFGAIISKDTNNYDALQSNLICNYRIKKAPEIRGSFYYESLFII